MHQSPFIEPNPSFEGAAERRGFSVPRYLWRLATPQAKRS